MRQPGDSGGSRWTGLDRIIGAWDRLALAVLVLGCAANVAFRLHRHPPERSLNAGDAYYYVLTMKSLLRDGDFDLRNQLEANGRYSVSLGSDGALYPKHPVLMPVLALPLFAVLGRAGCVLFSVLTVVALGFAVFALAREFASRRAAYLTAITFMSLPICVKYAYVFYPDMLGALLCLLAVLLAVRSRPVRAGLLLGLAMMIRVTNGLAFPILGLYLLHERGFRSSWRFALGVTAGLLPLLFLNTAMYGAPWIFSYQRTVHMLDFGRGVYIPGSGAASLFSLDHFGRNLAGAFTTAGRGILVTSAQCMAGVAGLVFFARRSWSVSLLVAALFLGYVLLFAAYGPWRASPYGHRFAFPGIFALCIPCAWLLEWTAARVRAGTFCLLHGALTFGLLVVQVLLGYEYFKQ